MKEFLQFTDEARIAAYISKSSAEEYLEKEVILDGIIDAIEAWLLPEDDNVLKLQAEELLSEANTLNQARKYGAALPKVAHAVQLIKLII